MKKIFKLISLLLYWGAILAAGCLYGFSAAVLVVVGAAFAAMALSAEGAIEEAEAEGRDSCDGCKHDLGGGQCRINLEAECGKSSHTGTNHFALLSKEDFEVTHWIQLPGAPEEEEHAEDG